MTRGGVAGWLVAFRKFGNLKIDSAIIIDLRLLHMGSNYPVWKALTYGKGMKSQLETRVKVKIYSKIYLCINS